MMVTMTNNKVKISLSQLQAVAELTPDVTVKQFVNWVMLLRQQWEYDEQERVNNAIDTLKWAYTE